MKTSLVTKIPTKTFAKLSRPKKRPLKKLVKQKRKKQARKTIFSIQRILPNSRLNSKSVSDARLNLLLRPRTLIRTRSNLTKVPQHYKLKTRKKILTKTLIKVILSLYLILKTKTILPNQVKLLLQFNCNRL